MQDTRSAPEDEDESTVSLAYNRLCIQERYEELPRCTDSFELHEITI